MIHLYLIIIVDDTKVRMNFRGDEDEALRQMLGDADDDAPKVRIEDLVNETLAAGKHSLSLLTETEVAQVKPMLIFKLLIFMYYWFDRHLKIIL